MYWFEQWADYQHHAAAQRSGEGGDRALATVKERVKALEAWEKVGSDFPQVQHSLYMPTATHFLVQPGSSARDESADANNGDGHDTSSPKY